MSCKHKIFKALYNIPFRGFALFKNMPALFKTLFSFFIFITSFFFITSFSLQANSNKLDIDNLKVTKTPVAKKEQAPLALEFKDKTPVDSNRVFLFETEIGNDVKKEDYSYCSKYYKDASIMLRDGNYAIALKNGQLVGYSPTRPNDKRVERYDPFIGLFTLKGAKTKYSYTLMDIDSYARSRDIIASNSTRAIKGKLLNDEEGFLRYAKFSSSIPKHGVISNICYQIYGISTFSNNFITKPYIDKFLDNVNAYYGDIGVRFALVDKSSATFKIKWSDPFFENNPFIKDDILISINNIAPKNLRELEWLIANLPFKSIAKILIKRDGKILPFEVKVDKKYGGLLLPDSFLEKDALRLSKSFQVLSVPKYGRFSKLRVGDKIIAINKTNMLSFNVANNTKKDEILKDIFTQVQTQKILFLEKKKQEQKLASKDNDLLNELGEDVRSFEQSLKKDSKNLKKVDEAKNSFLNKENNSKDLGLNALNFIDEFDKNNVKKDSFNNYKDTLKKDSMSKEFKPARLSKNNSSLKKLKIIDSYISPGEVVFLINRDGFELRVDDLPDKSNIFK